jgi:hypothetical protein
MTACTARPPTDPPALPLPCLALQRIPAWWVWVYWLNPVSWTLYGLVTSQLGDLDDEFIKNYAGEMEPIPQVGAGVSEIAWSRQLGG